MQSTILATFYLSTDLMSLSSPWSLWTLSPVWNRWIRGQRENTYMREIACDFAYLAYMAQYIYTFVVTSIFLKISLQHQIPMCLCATIPFSRRQLLDLHADSFSTCWYRKSNAHNCVCICGSVGPFFITFGEMFLLLS